VPFAIAAALSAAAPAHALTELYYVAEVNELDQAVLVRSDGIAYRIYKGFGCLDLTSYEERYVLVYSPDGFVKKESSEIILPDTGARCRIDDVEQLGYSSIKPKIRDLERRPLMEQELRLLVQVGLEALGYTVYPDGEDTEDTREAIAQFQAGNGIEPNGRMGPITVLALAGRLLAGTTEDAGVLAVGHSLLVYARKELDCRYEVTVGRVEDEGARVVVSSDLALAIVERDRVKTAEWGEDERLLICNRVVCNLDRGELAELAS
jgi:hypothetical protein